MVREPGEVTRRMRAFGMLARTREWRERRRRREVAAKIARLAEWAAVFPADERALIEQSLTTARGVFRADRALLVWEVPDEPYLNLALSAADSLTVSQEPPEKFDPALVPPENSDVFFFSSNEELGGRPGARCPSGAIHPGLVERFQIRWALGLSISGEAMVGWLLLLDPPRLGRLDPAIAGLIGAWIGTRRDHILRIEDARTEAITAERSQVARDLHDGLLQSFTGIVLQLETVHDLMERDPIQAKKILTGVEASIMSDQQELRAYVDHLRPRARRKSTEFDLRGRLAELKERFSREWGIPLEIEIGPMHPLVTQALGQETYRMVSEAVMNAAKHGQAKTIRAFLATREDRLWIRVIDDGIGFPFRGRYNLATLMEKQQGPSVLAERVAGLNGEMIVESTEEGSTLEIFLPLGWRADG
ncbi:MAG TPA: histidine kinase [Thermoanaerobaculia bacterium]|nr:histidine kinase [Thermoanaerobaculia bacterium]